MTRLALTVPYRDGEALHSFLARTAARNRVDTSTFCRHMRLSMVKVANGDPASVDLLADLTGVDRAVLGRNAFLKGKDRTWTIGGELLDWHMLRRRDARVCPLCLAADVASHDGPVEQVARCRTEWLVDQVRTCTIHGVELMSLDAVESKDVNLRWESHDFATRVTSRRPGGGLVRLEVRPTYVSGLETYLCGRLRGERPSPWLDGIAFNVVALFTERVGVAALHGPGVKFRDLGAADWKAAGDAGWAVMSEGEAGLACFVATMRCWDVPLQEASVGYQASFGSLWPFVLNASHRPEYRILCGVLTAHLGPVRPKLPSRLVTDGEDRRAKGYRLSTAAEEHRRRPETIRRLLSSRGLLGKGHEMVAPRRIIVEREVVEAVIEDERMRLPLVEVARRLDVSARQAGLLYRAGHFGAVVPECRRGVNVSVDPRAIDVFVDGMTKTASDLTKISPGQGTVAMAARSAARQVTDVVRLVVDRRLGWVGRLVGVAGLPAVVVHLNEVKDLLNDGPIPGLSKMAVSRELRIPYPGVLALVADGHLPTCKVRQRRSGQPYDVVTFESMESFGREYISVSCVGLRWGLHPHATRHRLAGSEIRPALSADRYLTPIYRVRDVPDLP